MKKILAVIIVLILVGVGTPYLVGIQTQKIFEHNIETIAEKTTFPLKVSQYKRGIFCSRAETICTLGKITLKTRYKIYHGPLFFDRSKIKPNGLHFGLAWIKSAFSIDPPDSEYAQMLVKIREAIGQDLVNIKSQITFMGDMRTYLYSPMVDHTTEDGLAIAWLGLEGEVMSDRQYQDFKGFFKAPGLSLKAKNWISGFKELDYSFHSTRSDYNLWVGGGSYSLKEAEFSLQAQTGENFVPAERFVLHQLNWDTGAELESALYQLRSNFQLNRVEAPEGEYGPFVTLVKLLNLDPEGFSALQDWVQKPAAAFPEGRMQALDAILQKLLTKTPTLVIENTKLNFPEGDLNIDLKLSMGGPNVPTKVENLAVYMDTLEGNVDILIAPLVLNKILSMGMEKALYAKPEVATLKPEEKKAALDKEVALKIEKLKSTGLLKEQDTHFEIKFNIEKGKIMVEGKEVDASTL